jgi:peptidyl-prolyl cis-trans isomerase SurA
LDQREGASRRILELGILRQGIATTLLFVTTGLCGAAPSCAQDVAAAIPAATTQTVAPLTPSAPPAEATEAPAAAAPVATTPGASAPAPAIDASDKPNPEDADGIAATVNDEAISDYELRQRVALFVATSGLNPSPEDMKRIRAQILAKMEDEKIQLQEAVKKNITVSPVEVDKTVNQLLAQNHMTLDQLRVILTQAGASELALRSQITAQIAWQKTVQQEYSDRVSISQAQVDAEVQRYADGASRPHFLVNEIFLPVSSPDQDANVLKDAQNIEKQIKDGAQFQAVAHQFSQNPAAAQGGSIGWVHEGQLAPELNGVLVQLKPGDVTSPIRAAGGYYLLNLQARQEPMGTKIATPATAASADGTLPLARLLLPLGTNPTKEIIQSAMNAAGQIHQGFAGCAQLKTLADKMKGSVYMDLGNMNTADLSPDIQKALAQTPPGETTMPLQSDAGVELIARCDKRVEIQTAYQMPTREQVQEQLFDQQISALAQRYMRDLKRDADVEVR